MKLPKFWTKVSKSIPNDAGDPYSVGFWGWSEISADDAERHAHTRAAKLTKLPPMSTPPAIARIIELHDRLSGALSDKKIA